MTDLRFLTGLRGVAALYVCFYHIKLYIEPYVYPKVFTFIQVGYLAVDFFFILSGFVIALTYFDKINTTSGRDILLFYSKRVARIYPLHLLLLLMYLSIPLVYVLTGRTMSGDERYGIDSFLMSLLLIQNWGLTNTLVWNIPSWSISTELFAYLMFPFIVVTIRRINSHFQLRGLLLTIVSLFLLVALLYEYYEAEGLGQYITSLGVWRCLIGFTIGVLLWNFYHGYKEWLATYSKILFYLGGAVLILGSYSKTYNYWYIHLSFSLLILGSIYYRNFVTAFCSTKVILWLGEISYSIYLIHYLVKDWFKILFLEGPSASLLWIAGYLAVVLLLSHFTYKIVEMPGKRLVTKFINNRVKMI